MYNGHMQPLSHKCRTDEIQGCMIPTIFERLIACLHLAIMQKDPSSLG